MTTPDPKTETEIARRRKMRNWALGGMLAFFAILFYAITIARIGGQ